MPLKWPALRDWSLPQLLRLRASWQEIRPDMPAERTAHQVSLAELDALIAAHVPQTPGEEGASQ